MDGVFVGKVRVFLLGKPGRLHRARDGADLGIDKGILADVEVSGRIFGLVLGPGEGLRHDIAHCALDLFLDLGLGIRKNFHREHPFGAVIHGFVFHVNEVPVFIEAVGVYIHLLGSVTHIPHCRKANLLVADDSDALREGNGLILPLIEAHVQILPNGAAPAPATSGRRQGADGQTQVLAGRDIRVLPKGLITNALIADHGIRSGDEPSVIFCQLLLRHIRAKEMGNVQEILAVCPDLVLGILGADGFPVQDLSLF